MYLPLVWIPTLQASSISKYSPPITINTWQRFFNINKYFNTPCIKWLLPRSNNLLKTSLRLQSQTISPIQMLCSKTPTRNGDTDGHQTIPRPERCTQIVSIRWFHCTSSTRRRHVRSTCQHQTVMNLLNHELAVMPYRDLPCLDTSTPLCRKLCVCRMNLHLCNIKHSL
jgi:hypothetical protein